jgi:hypothetical protein
MLIEATSGGSTGIYRVQTDGTTLLYASLSGVTPGDGSSIATVRSGNTAGFTYGDVFVAGVTTSPKIIRITNGGAPVTNPWVTLPTTGMGGEKVSGRRKGEEKRCQDPFLSLFRHLGNGS